VPFSCSNSALPLSTQTRCSSLWTTPEVDVFFFQFDQKFSDDWECQFMDWKNTNKKNNIDQIFIDKCLYVSRAGLMECLLPLERISICRGIQHYINDMKLRKSQQKEDIENANVPIANESANENNLVASLAPIEGNYFQDFENFGCSLVDSELFILFAENSQIHTLNLGISILLTFMYLVALNLLVNNQLNSSLNSTHQCGT
jgi:hypothetical protein